MRIRDGVATVTGGAERAASATGHARVREDPAVAGVDVPSERPASLAPATVRSAK
jgi:hypothetical protein